MNTSRSKSPRTITLQQVAARAGCSVPAAAGALHNGGGTARVSEELRQQVLLAAAELGYRPNYHARALRQQRAKVIGIVVGAANIHQQFWGQILSGVDLALHAAGYSLLVFGGDLEQAVERVEHRQLDALLVPGPLFHYRQEWIDAQTVPLVWLQPPRDSPHPGVDWNDADGVQEAARHLAALGHREVLWMGLKREGVLLERQRLEFFQRVAPSLGLEVKVLEIEESQRRPGGLVHDFHAHFSQYLAESPAPTAAMVYNDLAAQGVYGALWEHGLRVPDDISIVGYDDLQAPFCWPPLTTVSLRLPELGQEWVKLALEMIDAPATAPQRRQLPTQLIVRASTGRLRLDNEGATE